MAKQLKVSGEIVAPLVVVAMAFTCSVTTQASQPPEKAPLTITAAIERCRADLAKLPESVVPPADRQALSRQLDVAEQAANGGELPLALHRLSRVWRLVSAQQVRVKYEPEYKAGIPALERAWNAASGARKSILQMYDAASQRPGPAAARALAEAALYESRIVHDGALVYGGQVGVMAGYFYLGEAQGLLDFALFCRSLTGSGKAAPKIGALDSLIAELENNVLEEYGRDTASPHRDFFARANGSLKLARELNQSRELHGALYEYLLAQHAMGQFRATVTPQDRATIEKAAAAMEQKVNSAKSDSGIAAIFLELGKLELKGAATAADPKQNLINAQAMFTTVLPAYFKAVGE